MKTNIPEQTIIQRIQPECDTLHIKMKKEKDNQHKTNQEIADHTGIPISNIGKFFSGFLSNPNVFNVAAVCIYLGLSLDKLMGIPTEKSSKDAEDRIKELEMQVHDLSIHLDYAKKDCENLKQVANIRAKIIGVLLGICALMTTFTIVFLAIDKSIPDQGFFQADYTHPLGIIIIIAAIASIVAITAVIVSKIIKNKNKGLI